MKKEVVIPDIAENVETGIISNVLVSEGDEVDVEQALVEVETDKATTDIPSPFKGKILEVKVSAGDEVKVNQVIMLIEVVEKEQKSEQEIKEKVTENIQPKPEKKETEEEITGEEKRETARNEVAEKKEFSGYTEKVEKKEPKKQPGVSLSDIPASPSVRRMARESGIELSDVKGTGPGNRITVEDIQKLATGLQRPEKKQPSLDVELPDFTKWGETERKPLSRVRLLTAENTYKAWSTIPHVTQFEKANVTSLENFMKEFSKTAEKEGVKLTFTAVLLKISALALGKFPQFNSSIDLKNEEIIYKKYIHIGLAVDTDRGLLVPVIRDVNKKTLLQIAKETGELAEKARNKKITSEELQGGNFTLSNLGGIAGTYFTPIVLSPQVAILGVSKTQTEPLWTGKAFEPVQLLPLSLSYDHRVIDGADGARFIKWIKDTIENPFTLLV